MSSPAIIRICLAGILPAIAALAGFVILSRAGDLPKFPLPETDTSISFDLECSVPFFCGDLTQTLVVRAPYVETRKICLNNTSGEYRVQIYKLKNHGNFLIVGYDDAAIISVRPLTIRSSTADSTTKYPRISSCGKPMNIELMFQLKTMGRDQREYLGAFDRRISTSELRGSWAFMSPDESPERDMYLKR